jgi:transposase InsO family protein
LSQISRRLSPFGRFVIVERVLRGQPVAHVAAEVGVSRQTAHRWVRRFQEGGVDALLDRPSRPHRSPNLTTEDREVAVLEARARLRQGPLRLAAVTGVPPRTISRILARNGIPHLSSCDPITGEPIRATRASEHRYERSQPGELVHVDVKKLGRIPDGGGWRTHGWTASNHQSRIDKKPIGFDYVHAAIDDHSRLAYAEILPDEKGSTAAAFLTRAAAYFADHGIDHIDQVMSDNAFAYRRSNAFPAAVAALGASQLFIKPHCPWQNGKVERFNRTLATEWAYRQPFQSNQDRHDALAPWLEHYNTERIHSSHGLPPAGRVSPT